MIDELEIRGEWWLPGNRDRVAAGVLRYDQSSGARLDLIGTLDEPKADWLESFARYPLVLGIAGGQDVTLVDCVLMSREDARDVRTESYSARWILLDHHFERDEDLAFADLYFELDYLPDWVNQTGFEWKPAAVTADDKVERTLAWKEPDQYIAELEGGSVAITFVVSHGWQSRRPTFVEGLKVRVSLTQPAPLESVLDEVMVWRDLVAFATDHPNTVVRLDLVPYGATFDEVLTRVSVRFRVTRAFVRDPRRLFPNDMLCPFGTLLELVPFDKVITSWTSMRRDLEVVCAAYSNMLHSPDMYIEDQFLNVARAVEAYHRTRFPKPKKVTYERRLRAIARLLPKTLTFLLATNAIQSIVKMRNDVTHLNRVHRDAAEIIEMWRGCQSLMLVLQFLLLLELGVDSNDAETLVNDGPRMRDYRAGATS